MACLLTQDFSLSCTGFALAGGLASLYLANSEEVEVTKSGPLTKYDTITMDAGKTFFKYDFAKNSASFTQATEIAEAGTRLKQTLTFTIPNYDDVTATMIGEFAFSKLVAIVETRQGVRVILGLEGTAGLELETIEQNTGAAMGDMNGTKYVLSCFVSTAANELDAATVIPV
jgi:hypothetical protein